SGRKGEIADRVLAADGQQVAAGPTDGQILVDGQGAAQWDGAGHVLLERDRVAGGGVQDGLAERTGPAVEGVEHREGGGNGAVLQREQAGADRTAAGTTGREQAHGRASFGDVEGTTHHRPAGRAARTPGRRAAG